MSEDSVPEDTVPQDTTPEGAAPEETAPEGTAPEEAAPEDTVPEDTVPEDTVPEDAALEGSIRWWQSLTSPEVEALVEEDPVVVLPLGAIEQHGPHLPLSTDVVIALGVVERAFRRLSDDFPARVLPPLAVGASEEHLGFPGTLSLDARLVTEIVGRHGSSVARSGVRRLVLFNGHGGNRAAVETAALRLRIEEGLLVVRTGIFDLPRPRGADLPESEWRAGFHGGAVETAMMLHLRPDLVRSDHVTSFDSLGLQLEDSLGHVTAWGPAAFSWLARDLNSSGAVGDARLASAELGERLVGHYGDLLADVIRDARAFPVDRLR